MEAEQKLLKFDTHYSTFNHVISSLRYKGTYSDVTLVCDGKFYPLHKLVLAICSEYFSEIFEKTEGTNPMVILTGIQCPDLELLLNYMYIGEVNVRKDKIPSLMKAAELLRVKDLVIQNEEPKSFSYSSVSEKQSPPSTGENTSTDLSPRGSCTPGVQNPDIFIKQEQDEVLSIQQNSFENMEETKDRPKAYGAEDVLHAELSSTDFLDILQTIKDDPLSMSDCDDSDLVATSIKETNTTPSCIDDRRMKKSISGAVAEIYSPPLKMRRTSTRVSSIITSNSRSVFDGQKRMSDSDMVAIVTDDKLEITPGLSKNSMVAIYGGYRYSRDGKPLQSGQQSWRCVKRSCIGRVHILDDKHVTVKHDHHHEPDLALLLPKLNPVGSLNK